VTATGKTKALNFFSRSQNTLVFGRRGYLLSCCVSAVRVSIVTKRSGRWRK